MEKKEIIEGNKEIAEFMGLILKDANEIYDKPQYFKCNKKGKTHFVCYFDELIFHLSWSLLMPVVEKIEGMGAMLEYWVEMCGVRCTIYEIDNFHSNNRTLITEFNSEDSRSKIENVWFAIVEFLKWHKKNRAILSAPSAQ